MSARTGAAINPRQQEVLQNVLTPAQLFQILFYDSHTCQFNRHLIASRCELPADLHPFEDHFANSNLRDISSDVGPATIFHQLPLATSIHAAVNFTYLQL